MPKSQLNPYTSRPSKNFWRTAVATRKPEEIGELWVPKTMISPEMKVSTYGSCFAQHIGRNLDARGYNWFRPEAKPTGLSRADAETYNYGIFSSRTGNIYTASLLRQWLSWAEDETTVPSEIWDQDSRFFDPFRPVIEPDGFGSAEELVATRLETIRQFRASVCEADVFVFTLGLTESWWHAEKGYEYPMCPGTAAGTFDATCHRFQNQTFSEVYQSLTEALTIMRRMNPSLKVLLTVSPVPLTATATEDHVLVATTWSKSVLRAVAGQLTQEQDWVDYFPSYEIVTAPVFGGKLYADNKRSMRPKGVAFVMDRFFQSLNPEEITPVAPAPDARRSLAQQSEDVVCEEVLLDAFGPEQ